MKLKLNRNLQIGFGSAILLLVVVGIISYTTLKNLLDSNKLVAHSNEVIEKLERTLSIMKDAETGQRGYLLTGNKHFLEPYTGAYQNALNQVGEIKKLTADNIEQQINMASLKAVLANRLDILQVLIDKKNRTSQLAKQIWTVAKKLWTG